MSFAGAGYGVGNRYLAGAGSRRTQRPALLPKWSFTCLQSRRRTTSQARRGMRIGRYPARREVVKIEPSAIRDVYVFVRRGDLLLLLLREGTGYKDGEWGPPAGKVEVGETYRGAAARELREETGLDADPAVLRFVHLLHRDPAPGEAWPWVGAFFDASGVPGDPTNREPTRCRTMGWHPVDALPSPMVDYVEHVLRAVAQSMAYSEWRS